MTDKNAHESNHCLINTSVSKTKLFNELLHLKHGQYLEPLNRTLHNSNDGLQ